MAALAQVVEGKSISRGVPLDEEQGIGPLTLGGYVREIARRFGPNEAAVITINGQTERWTYDELYARALAVAKALVGCGVGKGTRVGVLMTNRLEFLASVFGIGLAGGVATTISTFFTPAELEQVLGMSGISVLLLEKQVLKKKYAEMLAEVEPAIASAAPGKLVSLKFPFLTHLAMVDDDLGPGAPATGAIEGWNQFLARGKDVSEERVLARCDAVAPSDPGVLFFSSGSTGKAKGILSANRGVCLQLWRWVQWYNIGEPLRVWSANGFFWSGNFCQALGGALSGGGSLILQRWFDAEEAIELMVREKATMPVAWPHQWAQLVAAPSWLEADLSELRWVEKTSILAQHPKIQSDWEQPGAAYGNTETFTLISIFPAGTPQEVIASSHGVPTGGSTIKIVDPLTGATMPTGERGEITVKGPTLMLGYLGIPLDETLDEDGFLRTNDGGYIDAEGRLYWEGRLNDIIKTGGANVSPIEIDDVIRACPGVKVSQTVGVPDELLGELVVSCIVRHDTAEGAALDEAMIKNHAKEKLASYKVPRKVLFVEEGDLKTTGSNKIKTADLRELADKLLKAVA